MCKRKINFLILSFCVGLLLLICIKYYCLNVNRKGSCMPDYDLIGNDPAEPDPTCPSGLLIAAGRKLGVMSIIESQPHQLLMALALKQATYMADVEVQGHQGFSQRANDVMKQFPGASVEEIAAESWPNQTDVEAADDAYACWKQSPGHWYSCNSAHTYYGYGMTRGNNGIWYSCGLFANCVDSPAPLPEPAPEATGWFKRLLIWLKGK